MKRKYNKIIFILICVGFLHTACKNKNDDYPVPQASTQASFTYTITNNGRPPCEVKFKNTSINAIGCLWNFGNGSTSTEENPILTISSEDTIIVKLKVTPKNALYYNVLEYSKSFEFISTLYKLDFDNPAGVMPSDIVLVNGDQGTPSSPSYASMRDSAWIVAYRSSIQSWAAMGLSYYNPPKEANDWMILPAVSLGSPGDSVVISWDAISLTTSGNYPDHYDLRISTTTQDTSGCKANPYLLRVIDESSANWVHHVVSLKQYSGSSAYLAFHLNTPYDTGDRLAIDNIVIRVVSSKKKNI